MCICKKCESGIHSHPVYVNWGYICSWGYPQFEKGFNTIKKGCTTPWRALEFIIRPRGVIPMCIGNKQTSFAPKKFSAMQLEIHSLYTSGKLGIYPPLHIHNTHIPTCIVTHFSYVCISPVHTFYK